METPEWLFTASAWLQSLPYIQKYFSLSSCSNVGRYTYIWCIWQCCLACSETKPRFSHVIRLLEPMYRAPRTVWWWGAARVRAEAAAMWQAFECWTRWTPRHASRYRRDWQRGKAGPAGQSKGRRPTRCLDQTETVNKQNGDRKPFDRHKQSVSGSCRGSKARGRTVLAAGMKLGSVHGKAPGSGWENTKARRPV
jgi:hypothetical protein